MLENFSNRFQKALDLRGMKQSDVVRATGIGKSAISQYLSGMYEPKQKNIFLLARALNVSESWLMGLDVPMEREKPTAISDDELLAKLSSRPLLRELLEALSKLDDDGLETFIRLSGMIENGPDK